MYVKSKLCEAFVTRSGKFNEAKGVCLLRCSHRTPHPALRHQLPNLRVRIGVSDCYWVHGLWDGGLRGAVGWDATVCQAGKLMCKYFHKFIFYSVKFWVSCLETYKKFAQLIWASRQKLSHSLALSHSHTYSLSISPHFSPMLSWVWNLIFAAGKTFLRVHADYFKNLFISL